MLIENILIIIINSLFSVTYQSSLIVKIIFTTLYLDIEESHACTTVGLAQFCYYTNRRNFGEAEEFCKTKNGDLVSIDSTWEQAAVHKLVNSISGGTTRTWIGYIDKEATGTNWNWIDGKGGYTNWETNYPTAPTSLLCASLLNSNGDWQDKYCSNRYSVVCRSVSYSIVLI